MINLVKAEIIIVHPKKNPTNLAAVRGKGRQLVFSFRTDILVLNR
jgi:hypothetical protein